MHTKRNAQMHARPFHMKDSYSQTTCMTEQLGWKIAKKVGPQLPPHAKPDMRRRRVANSKVILYVAHGTSPPNKKSKQVQIGEWKVQITWDGWLPCIPTIFYILNKSGLLISLQAYSFFFNMTLQAYSTMRNITPTAHILFTPSCHHAWLNCKVQVLILQLTNYLIIS
jgi:hypothetical protein